MNTPMFFSTVAASPAVTALLGTAPTRLYLFGHALRMYNGGVPIEKPYAVWQVVTGSPENYLGCPPDVDLATIQVDAYAETADQVRDVIEAIRDAVEPYAHITSWMGESWEPDTMLYRSGFSVDWFVSR